MEKHFYSLNIRVLICREEGEFLAHALEMDLLAYGASEEEAVETLKETVAAQLSFAHQMKDPGLIIFQPEKKLIARWEDANSKAFISQVLGDKSARLEAVAAVIQFSKQELISLRNRRYTQANLACA